MALSITNEAVRDLILGVRGLDDLKREMLVGQLDRYRLSLEWIPPRPGGSLLDLGSCGDLVPAYQNLLGYDRVVCADASCEQQTHVLQLTDGRSFSYDSIRVDLEHKPLPFPDESFDQVVAMEVLEHLAVDPMFMLAEANRVLRPGGSLLLTTPNIASIQSLYKLLWGQHPAIGRQTFGPGIMDRHHREYASDEVREVLQCAGFTVNQQDTFDMEPLGNAVKQVGRLVRMLSWLRPNLRRIPRGSTTRCTATKSGPVTERFPHLIYPRYAYYDYAAYDRKLTELFDGHRYWQTDAAEDSMAAPRTRESNEFAASAAAAEPASV